jgi:2-polyprenyl-3-methyl-5-hydroxy-6-metoxy-1,4-benzoquinol methylase
MPGDDSVPQDTLHERALVRAGWELVDLLGRLEVRTSRDILQPRWDAERARSAATLTPLKTGAGVGPTALEVYHRPSVQTRFRRTLDFVQPGDRVFEIGPGRGYLAGLIMRDGGADAYRGVDLTKSNVEATRELLELNGYGGQAELDIRNLYDLTRADAAEFGTTLLVCCEVIEHVPDPEHAVRTLAAALPPGADLLISVPLLGRLEGEWGHIAIFDALRTRDMVENSGLVVHAVDVVDNIWVFVLASHEPGPSARAARGAAAVAGELANENPPRAMERIALDATDIIPSVWRERLVSHRLDHGKDGLRCDLTAKRQLRSASGGRGGVRFPVRSPRGIRLEVALDKIDNVTAFHVDAYAAEQRVARWTWDPIRVRPRQSKVTFTLRPGRIDRQFKLTKLGPLESADAIDFLAVVKPGSSASFRITRAAVIV